MEEEELSRRLSPDDRRLEDHIDSKSDRLAQPCARESVAADVSPAIRHTATTQQAAGARCTRYPEMNCFIGGELVKERHG